jgi:hypothetical protein
MAAESRLDAAAAGCGNGSPSRLAGFLFFLFFFFFCFVRVDAKGAAITFVLHMKIKNMSYGMFCVFNQQTHVFYCRRPLHPGSQPNFLAVCLFLFFLACPLLLLLHG